MSDNEKQRARTVNHNFPLRKPVNTLAIVPKSEKITVTARKIYNVMLQYAQQQGLHKDSYSVRLADIAAGIEFNSNNTEVIKQYFRQMATTGVEWQSPTADDGARWSVSALIAHADLVLKGNELILEWSYAANIKQELLDPQRFAKMSLRVLVTLNTMASLVLYEISCRYVDNPAGLTARQPWTWWRPVLTGSPDSSTSAYQEYKIFNRDVLKKAVKKVNEFTDIEVELIEHRVGRSVRDLQFKVRRKPRECELSGNTIQPVDLKAVEALIKLGIRQERVEKLLLKYGTLQLDSALKIIRDRFQRSAMEPIRNPEKYLVAILDSGQFEDVHKSEELRENPDILDSKAKRLKLIEQYMAQRRTELNSLFLEMPADEQANWITKFTHDTLPKNGAILKSYQKKGLQSPIVRPLFLKYFGNAIWGSEWDKPSDSDLLELAIKI